jgi:hypothetical protein
MLLGSSSGGDVALLLAACVDGCASSQSKGTKVAASATLARATHKTTHPAVLALAAPVLAANAGHKNKDAATAACKGCEACLSSLQASDPAFAASVLGEAAGGAGGGGLALVLVPLLAGLGGKSPEGKKASRACCALVSASLDVASGATGPAAAAAALSGAAASSLPVAGKAYGDAVAAFPGLSVSQVGDLTAAGVADKGGSSGVSGKDKGNPAKRSSLLGRMMMGGKKKAEAPLDLPEPPPKATDANAAAPAAAPTAAAPVADAAPAAAAPTAAAAPAAVAADGTAAPPPS